MQGKFNLISLVMNFKIAVVPSDDLFYMLQHSFPPPLFFHSFFYFIAFFFFFCMF